jgi:histidinol-phosphate aminotransferase
MYELSAQFNNCRFVGVPLKADFSLDAGAMLDAMVRHKPAVIFIAHPNNPTGNLFDRRTVRAIVEAAPGIVVIDEAYLPFAQDTWLPALGQHPNLLVLRTLSKLGLAGLRLGYLCGHPAWIAELEKVRPPYNVNVLTLAAVDLLLDHAGVLDAQAARIRDERSRVLQEVRRLTGVTAFESAANFLLLRVEDPDRVFAGLKHRGILVKNVSRMHPLLAGCLRATIGSAEENAAFLAALAGSLEDKR